MPRARAGVERAQFGERYGASTECLIGQNSPSQVNQSSAVTLLDLRTGSHRTLLATLPDHWLLLLDPRTGRPVRPPIQAATGEIDDVSFSSDGRSVVVASYDHTASVWDLPSETRVGNPFGPYPGVVPATLFEPDGRLLINLSANGVQWPMDMRSWARFACQAAGRDLTPQEWQNLLPNRAYETVCPLSGPRPAG